MAQNLDQRRFHLLDASAADHRGGDHRRLGEWRIRQVFAELGLDSFFVFRKVNLGQRDHGARDTEVSQDLQMLLGLRHPAVIRRHHEQRQINRTDAGDHVLHEILVTGNINDAQVVGHASRAWVPRHLRRVRLRVVASARLGNLATGRQAAGPASSSR